MADRIKWLAPGEEKRGGYTGGKPAATVRPPEKVPSGEIRPASNGDGQGASGKK